MKKKNNVVAAPTEDDYDSFDNRTHVYAKPGMYIGSIEKEEREEFIYSEKLQKIILKYIHLPVGVERLFLEILSNASDNCGKTREAEQDPGKIEVTMDYNTVTIKNYGLPIPTGPKKGKGVHVPEFIFGTVLCGSNLKNDARHGIGTNGIGSKATNIMSTRFEVIIENAITKERYVQTWSDNMKVCGKHDIKPYHGKISSTQISYDMDFKVFKYKKYPEEAIELFKKHTLDISFNAKLPVIFNGVEYDYSNLMDYAQLYLPIENPVIYQDDVTEMIVFDSPDEGFQTSFVNCMLTKDGGVHLDAAYKAIGDKFIKTINDKMSRGLDKDLTEREKKSYMVGINDIKPHLSVILSCNVVNPDFSSQSKTKLTKPTPVIDLDEEQLQTIYGWQLMKRLEAAIDAKQFAKLSKTDGKKSNFVELEKGLDCNDAGTIRSSECTLCMVEGSSPVGYLQVYRSSIPNGTNQIGILPLKGKCLNVMNAKIKQIEKNKEIRELKLMLGLKEGVDYSDPVNFKNLRYGRILIVTDADVDGKHIMGLILNFFYCRFPGLLDVPGFITYKKTPILRLRKGKQTKKFYSQREYEAWLAKNDVKGYTAEYFKGLGSSTKEDVKDDLKDEVIVKCINDEDAESAIKLAFDKKLRHERKNWILNWVERIDVDSMLNQPISLFIHHEFITFSISNLRRAIPGKDGNKEAHRKIICASYQHFGIDFNKHYKLERVCDLDGFISSKMQYHHGNSIISKILTHLSQDFVNTNNLNLFFGKGQIGNVLGGPDQHASPRYLETYPTELFPYIYHPDDNKLTKPIVEQNKELEPEVYFTTIPMVLVNGTKGIATGFFTFVPNHNPLDIINWLKLRLKGAINLPSISPWYKDFKGEITIVDRRRKNQRKTVYKNSVTETEDISFEEEEESESDKESIDESDDNYNEYVEDFMEKLTLKENPLLSFDVTGVYHIAKNGNIIITELPIGMNPTLYYNKHLVPLLKKKLLKKVINDCTDDSIRFELKGYVGNPSYKKLHLKKRYSLSNMVLLDTNNKPVKYDTANDLIEAFYQERLPIYKQRKIYKLGILQKKIDKVTIVIKFHNLIKNKSLVVQNVDKEVIYENLDKFNIPRKIYDNAKISSLSKNETSLLEAELEGYKKEYGTLNKLTPSDIWMNDLNALEDKYRQVYKIKKN